MCFPSGNLPCTTSSDWISLNAGASFLWETFGKFWSIGRFYPISRCNGPCGNCFSYFFSVQISYRRKLISWTFKFSFYMELAKCGTETNFHFGILLQICCRIHPIQQFFSEIISNCRNLFFFAGKFWEIERFVLWLPFAHFSDNFRSNHWSSALLPCFGKRSICKNYLFVLCFVYLCVIVASCRMWRKNVHYVW